MWLFAVFTLEILQDYFELELPVVQKSWEQAQIRFWTDLTNMAAAQRHSPAEFGYDDGATRAFLQTVQKLGEELSVLISDNWTICGLDKSATIFQ